MSEAFPELLRGLGDLHDVSIALVSYDASSNCLIIECEDLNWGIDGEPGYRPRPCRLVFSSVSAFSIVAGQDRFHTSIIGEGAVISSASAITKDDVTRLDIVFSTSERWCVEFTTVEIEDR